MGVIRHQAGEKPVDDQPPLFSLVLVGNQRVLRFAPLTVTALPRRDRPPAASGNDHRHQDAIAVTAIPQHWLTLFRARVAGPFGPRGATVRRTTRRPRSGGVSCQR